MLFYFLRHKIGIQNEDRLTLNDSFIAMPLLKVKN